MTSQIQSGSDQPTAHRTDNGGDRVQQRRPGVKCGPAQVRHYRRQHRGEHVEPHGMDAYAEGEK